MNGKRKSKTAVVRDVGWAPFLRKVPPALLQVLLNVERLLVLTRLVARGALVRGFGSVSDYLVDRTPQLAPFLAAGIRHMRVHFRGQGRGKG